MDKIIILIKIPDRGLKKESFMPLLKFTWLMLFFLFMGSVNFVQAQSVFPTYSIDWSPNDQWVATTHGDNRIRVWNAITGLVERSIEIIPPTLFQADPPGILDIEWSPTGDRLAFFIRDRDHTLIRIVGANTFNTITDITSNGALLDLVTDIEWSVDGSSIAGATQSGRGSAGDYFVRVWDASSGNLTSELRTNTGIYQVQWNPDPSRQQLAMSGGTLAQIWNISSGVVYPLEGHEGAINSVSWNPDGTRLATKDNIAIQIWDGTIGQNLNQIYLGNSVSTNKIVWSKSNDGFLAQGIYELYSLNATGTRISPNDVPLPNRYFDLNTSGNRIVISPDSQSIVIYDLSGQIIPFVTPTPAPATATPTATATATSTHTATVTSTWTPTRTPIHTFTPTNTPTRTLTRTPTRTPTPLPQTGWITFVSDRTGNFEIYTVNPDTGYLIQMTTSTTATEEHPIWSPDRTKIVFAANRNQPGNIDLYVLDVATKTVSQIDTGLSSCIANSEENWPAWIQVGSVHKLAFQSNCDGDLELYIIPINSSGQRTGSVSKVTDNTAEDSQPSWDDSGNRLTFTSDRDGNKEIYKLNLNVAFPHNPVRLTNDPASDNQPIWSPVGDYIGFTSNRNSDGDDEIYYMNSDGTGLQRITNNTWEDRLVDWSPETTTTYLEIVYVRKDNAGTDLDLALWRKGNGCAQLQR
jgi:hypothetical protein